jgi:hypothetical protein
MPKSYFWGSSGILTLMAPRISIMTIPTSEVVARTARRLAVHCPPELGEGRRRASSGACVFPYAGPLEALRFLWLTRRCAQFGVTTLMQPAGKETT